MYSAVSTMTWRLSRPSYSLLMRSISARTRSDTSTVLASDCLLMERRIPGMPSIRAMFVTSSWPSTTSARSLTSTGTSLPVPGSTRLATTTLRIISRLSNSPIVRTSTLDPLSSTTPPATLRLALLRAATTACGEMEVEASLSASRSTWISLRYPPRMLTEATPSSLSRRYLTIRSTTCLIR
jgi:hypothetical protein